MHQDVEPGALLIADDDGQRILELLAKADVQHAGVQRAPHMLTSNQCGRGKDPVTVLGRIRSLVAVNMIVPTMILLCCGFGQRRVQRIFHDGLGRVLPGPHTKSDGALVHQHGKAVEHRQSE